MIYFSKAAKSDLLLIEEYSLLEWGSEKTLSYMRSIQKALMTIHALPRAGRPGFHIYKECRIFSAGRHIILYREIGGGIEIGRILHKRMDIGKTGHGFSDAVQVKYSSG